MTLQIQIAELTANDIPDIVVLEQACWLPELQADPDILEKRLASAHKMVGARIGGELVGLIAYRHTWFSPDDVAVFPKTFAEFSSGCCEGKHNAVYGYNMSVHPRVRGSKVIHVLLRAAIEKVRTHGCRYIVGDGRCPSYNGSEDGRGSIRKSEVFHSAVDRYMSGGVFPSMKEFLTDPSLRFFYRMMHCRFLWILPDFFPGDSASGGYRVIYCVDLD
jgi:GNAT superfamily N-acetyltransferase